MFKFFRNLFLFIAAYWILMLVMTIATSMTTQVLLNV